MIYFNSNLAILLANFLYGEVAERVNCEQVSN